jgi:hypothetical protein
MIELKEIPIDPTFIILIVGLLLAFYNGMFLTNKSKQWHAVGWIIRAALMPILWPQYFYMMLYIVITWHLYDIIINIYLKQKWWYQGRTSFIDKNIPPSFIWMFKLVIFIIFVVELFYYVA